MTPFVPATLKIESQKAWVKKMMQIEQVTKKDAVALYRKLKHDEIYINDLYQVNIDRSPEHGFGEEMNVVHVSIKRRDKEVVHDWRHLQQIKNELVGADYDAIELYPAESRLVDSANQYHLWVFANDDFRVPVGWFERFTGGSAEAERIGAKQRDFEETS